MIRRALSLKLQSCSCSWRKTQSVVELGAAVLPQTGLSPGEGKGVAVRQALIIPFTEEIRLTKNQIVWPLTVVPRN